MRKIDYIKWSRKETNKKIADTIKTIGKGNQISILLWTPIIWVIRIIIYIVSWVWFAIALFRDLSFTPHFMECEIAEADNIQEYLQRKRQEYVHRSSYGNFSISEQNRIDALFEYLHTKYPVPQATEDNTKHQEIIENITDVKMRVTAVIGNTQKILDDTTIDEVKDGVAEIIDYNRQVEADKYKTQQERDDEFREAKLRQERTARRTRFETSPEDLECKLSKEQRVLLLDHINSIKVFVRDITLVELENVMMCLHTEPLQTTHNKILALLFQRLSAHRLISPKWQRVAGNKECFASKSGKLLTAKDLSAAKQQAGLIDPEKAEMIDECVEALISKK